MNIALDINTLVAFGGFLMGVAAIVTAIFTGRNTVRKSEIEALTAIIQAVKMENERLLKRIEELEKENEELRRENDEFRKQLKQLQSRRKPQ